MIHIQLPVNNWLEAVQRLPDGSLVKAIDQGSIFAEVHAINPNINTVLRHWYDFGQVFGGTYEDNKARARTFFDTFIDGTFINNIAHHCDYIEEWNEYLATSQNQTEVGDRLRWAEAAADVWLNEYRIRPELNHIRLVLCNTAVGNNIAGGFFDIARNYDAVLGYHPYSYWVNGVRDSGDWQYHSGRWAYMESVYGGAVDWMFTEAGPYQSAVDGWRSPNCLGNDRTLYVESMRHWIRDVKTTQAYQDGRIKGFALFTTGRVGSQWQHFWTEQPELNMLADMVAEEWQQVDPPEPPDPPQECYGLPREQYNRTFNVIPSYATEEEAVSIFLEGWRRSRETTGGSYDDAGIGDLQNKTANLYGIPDGDRQVYIDWYNENYPGTNVVFIAMPSTGQELEYEIVDIVNDLTQHATLDYSTRSLSDITALTIHHTVSPPDITIESIASYHVNGRGWPGIGYHFVIKDNGEIYQTNYLETKSYHAGSLDAPGDENLWSVGISLQGDFTYDPPPQAQQDATRWLVAHLQEVLGDLDVIPHRNMPGAQTACPGNTWEQWFDYVAGN